MYLSSEEKMFVAGYVQPFMNQQFFKRTSAIKEATMKVTDDFH